ncbi:MAG TPA: lysylphosphatidylglycerol synthase transmembrane domain-containing protein [Methylomirabilota bacterium]|nr:lysylphosphatidylglycerol synthase transmembrane domain-containing protein [Methylomirabilota bacterium]
MTETATGMLEAKARPDADARTATTGPSGLGRAKLTAGGIAFVLLTVGIFWYQFHRIQAGDAAPGWDQLRWGYLALILLLLPMEALACGLRIWIVCRVLEPGVSLWTCIKSEWANEFVAMLTPSQSGGGPGQIYILNRGGASVGTALTITLISFVGTMIVLFCMGLYSLVVSGISKTGPLFVTAAGTLTVISALMISAAVCPGVFRAVVAALSRGFSRLIGAPGRIEGWWPPSAPRSGPPVDCMDRLAAKLSDLLYNYRDDIARFTRQGKGAFVWVCVLSPVFLFSRAFMPYLCVRFLGIEASSAREIVEAQMALIFLIFFAPTPGGAGLAEGASLSIMSEVVSVGFAPYYNLLWRFSTLYVGALAGMLCIARALLQDARHLIRHRR